MEEESAGMEEDDDSDMGAMDDMDFDEGMMGDEF